MGCKRLGSGQGGKLIWRHTGGTIGEIANSLCYLVLSCVSLCSINYVFLSFVLVSMFSKLIWRHTGGKEDIANLTACVIF